jgi:threonine/homoserine/homoserine lactone efflux protein
MGRSIASEPAAALLLAMIRWGSVGPLIATGLAIMGSPGPATISLAAAGAAYGMRRSLAYAVGVIAGTTGVLLAVATGITVTLLAVPALRIVLIALSAAYILRLAYRVATAPPLGAESATQAAPSLAGGTLLGIANPKGWVAIAATFASARLADGATTDAAAKIALLSAVIVVITTTWLIIGASFAPLLRDPRRARIINVTLAVVLVGATAVAVVH